MLTVEGIYRNGQITLNQIPEEIGEGKVLITFLEPQMIDLRERQISAEQAAELKAKFALIADDWNRTEMDVYDVD